jgi:hypothetical protein
MSLGKGKILCDNDFTALYDAQTVGTDTTYLGGGWSLIGVNEGSIASTVDETGGVLAITTDTADNDNHAVAAGVFAPADGTLTVEGRFKYSNVDCAIFAGFSETLDSATPVMPAEFATATMTYNGTGGMLGIQYDVDGTTDDFRAVMGDAAVARSDSANGIRANATVTADRWFEFQVNLYPDGSGEVYFSHSGDVNADSEGELRLVKRFDTGTLLTPTDVFHPVLMIENRTANARVLEVDYLRCWAGRDWAVD